LPPELVIGSVFSTQLTTGQQFYVVLPDGVATVNTTTAAALRATQSFGLLSPPSLEPSVVVPLPDRVYTSPLPDAPIKLVNRQDEPILCWTWRRTTGEQGPKTAVITGPRLPIPASALTAGISQIEGTATVYIDGGKYIQVASPDPRFGEALYYIDPQGVRYGLPDEKTAGSLGLSAPQLAPWEVVRLLVEGPVLSQEAALLEHDTVTTESSPRKVSAGAG
jgi:type VII secretion protein EccB